MHRAETHAASTDRILATEFAAGTSIEHVAGAAVPQALHDHVDQGNHA